MKVLSYYFCQGLSCCGFTELECQGMYQSDIFGHFTVRKLKMESFHSHSRLSKFKSKLFSEWEAFRKVCVATRTPAKGSSGQFMKKVSGLLKFDSNSTHDVVPGM